MMFVRTGRIFCITYICNSIGFTVQEHHFLCEFQKRERQRRKQVAFIHAFQRVTGWWEVMCQIVSEYIPELHTE